MRQPRTIDPKTASQRRYIYVFQSGKIARQLKCKHCGAVPSEVGVVRQVNRGNGQPTTETVKL